MSVQPGQPGQPDLRDLGYEQARDELVDVVRRLEAGGATLEESLALWERGEALAARCEDWLAGARARLDARTGAAAAPADDETEDTEDDDLDDAADDED